MFGNYIRAGLHAAAGELSVSSGGKVSTLSYLLVFFIRRSFLTLLHFEENCYLKFVTSFPKCASESRVR